MRLIILFASLLFATSRAQTEKWSQVDSVIASSRVTINEQGPDGNVPDVTVDGTTINFDVCSVDSCEDNHPVVTVEIVLHTAIIGIRGSFIQQSTGSNGADDCIGDSEHSDWYPSITGHEGYVMFGTPDQVIYGGCAHGGNFGTETNNVDATVADGTTILRFVGTQSVDAETFTIDFSGLEVLVESPWMDMSSMVLSSNVIVNDNGPNGNVPAVTVDGTVINFDVCEVSSCEDNHPVVTVEITLNARVIGVRGSFTQTSTGSNAADDCNGGDEQTEWYPAVTGHDGYVMFGTPDQVLYGGCAHGTNFGAETNTIEETIVGETTIIRFAGTQSVDDESFAVDFANLEVLPVGDDYGDFSSEINMQMNGYTFSHPEYARSFIAVGTADRDQFCAGIEDTSYCGFHNPGVGALSIVMHEPGRVDIAYGSTWSSADQYVTVDLNGVEMDRVTGSGRGVDNRASYAMDVMPGDVVSFSEYGETVLNVHSFEFTEREIDYADFSTEANMQMNGYTFSHPEYEHSFIVPGTDNRNTFCAGIEDTSYCGFYHPGEGVLSITMHERGTVDISYGSSYSNGQQYVTIDKNGVEVDRVTGLGRDVDNRASYTMDVLPGDVISFSEYGETVINLHNFEFMEYSIYGDFSSEELMQSNGYSFSHPDYEHSFIAAGTGDRSTFCTGVPDTSYCGFAYPGDGVLSVTIAEAGEVDVEYGSTYSSTTQYVTVDLNGVEVDRVTGLGRNVDNRATYSMNVEAGDVVSFSEYGDTVINVHRFTFQEGQHVPTMEECRDAGDDATAVPMDSVTGAQSTISGDMATIVIDYPGYMRLVSMQWVGGDASPLDTWTITRDDGCHSPNSATQDISYATLSSIITRTGAFAEFNILAEFEYYTENSNEHSINTGDVEQVTNHREIKFALRAPLTHVVTVTAPFLQGTGLLYDITSHGIVEEGGEQVVYVGFRTFVAQGHSFTGECDIASPYFNTDSAECTTGEVSDFDHPDQGPGSVQEWTVRVKNPTTCQDAVHTEQIDVDLTMATGSVERIQFMVAMVDEVGPDCRVLIGDVDLTSSVLISDGSGEWVNPAENNQMVFYLNSIMHFQVTFDSLMLPTFVSLTSMSITQNGAVKCDTDCFTAAEFVCEACDADRKSSGSTYEFSVVLTDATFDAEAGVNTDTSFEVNFGIQYDRRRRLAKTLDAFTVPIKFSLRDWDCKAPNAILSSVKSVDCDFASMSKKMICSADGWEDVSQCTAPVERYFSILGFVGSMIVVAYAMSKFAFVSKDALGNYNPVAIQAEP
jgi:co-chaperonin GroES (HSP10)